MPHGAWPGRRNQPAIVGWMLSPLSGSDGHSRFGILYRRPCFANRDKRGLGDPWWVGVIRWTDCVARVHLGEVELPRRHGSPCWGI
ncbi:hypothetical protein BJX76DRAFT_325799, partial [Aspergillus varians]